MYRYKDQLENFYTLKSVFLEKDEFSRYKFKYDRTLTNLKLSINSKLKQLAKGKKNFKLLKVNNDLHEVNETDEESGKIFS